MGEKEVSRRTALKTGLSAVGVAAAGALSGCSGLTNNGDDGESGDGGETGTDGKTSDGGGTDDGPLLTSRIPAGAELVIEADIDSLLSDDAVLDGVNEVLQSQSKVPNSVDTLLTEFETSYGLDPQGATRVVLFDSEDFENGSGLILWSDWSRETVFEQYEAESDTTVTRDSYRGHSTISGEDDPVMELARACLFPGHRRCLSLSSMSGTAMARRCPVTFAKRSKPKTLGSSDMRSTPRATTQRVYQSL